MLAPNAESEALSSRAQRGICRSQSPLNCRFLAALGMTKGLAPGVEGVATAGVAEGSFAALRMTKGADASLGTGRPPSLSQTWERVAAQWRRRVRAGEGRMR